MCNNLENYGSKNKYLLSNVNSHVIIKQIESNLFSLCDINKRNNDKYIIAFMKWYREFNDTQNGQQIALIFENENVSKGLENKFYMLNELL